MKMSQFTFRDQIVSFEDYMDMYLKNKSTDCILYSDDGSKFKVHKELFGQTQFLRKILSSANERCCGMLEVFCPCSTDELSHLVNFLYDGEIHCEEEFDSLKILENLNKILGFPRNIPMNAPNDLISGVLSMDNITESLTITEEVFENISLEDSYSCQYCFEKFRKKRYLKKHELIHTDEKPSGKKPYSCRYCSKIFKRKDHRKGHERVHTGEKPYSCKVCYKSFSNARNMKVHERIHTGEKPYSCKTCNKSFSDPSSMRVHEKIHSGEKPYICNICNKSFSTSGNLKKHELNHNGKKPYSCGYCSKMFVRRDSLKVHERVHTGPTGEKPYACNTCNKYFSTDSILEKHELIHRR